MTQSIHDPALRQQQRDQWIARVEALVTQVTEWSIAEGWTVERAPKTIREKLLGTYDVSKLHVKLPGGELILEPIGIQVPGEDGRVDLEAFPTLNRVKLIGGQEWRIITDSNVPLRLPWNRETYAQLAHDLLN
jgi:hypothetical protein